MVLPRVFFRVAVVLFIGWSAVCLLGIGIARIARSPVLVMNFGRVFGYYDLARDVSLITPPILPTPISLATWSADGRYIADGGSSSILIFDTQQQSLTTVEQRMMRCVSWSHSNRLGCTGFPDTAYVVHPSTASVEQLFPSYSIGSFAWGPEGEQIAFSSPDSTNTFTDIYAADNLTDTPRLLASFEGWAIVDSWSPDRRYLLTFTTSHEIWTVYLISIEDGQIISLSTDFEMPFPDLRDMTWSPDGSRLVFRSIIRTSAWTYIGGLYVLEMETMTVRQIAEEGSIPLWSPDGNRIVFMYSEFNDGRPIHRMVAVNHDGSGRTVIAEDGGAFWSPDSEHLFLYQYGTVHMTSPNSEHPPRLLYALAERYPHLTSYAFWK